MYKIYTDGAYSHLRDVGGYAYIILKDNEVVCEGSGHYDHTTNNQMELMAVIKALSRIKESSHITIISDSQYVINIASHKAKINKNKGSPSVLSHQVRESPEIAKTYGRANGSDQDSKKAGKFVTFHKYRIYTNIHSFFLPLQETHLL